MSGEAEGRGSEDGGDSALVAEFVLGLLAPAEHEAMARRIATEPELAAELKFWQGRFASLDSGFAETVPPPTMLRRIENRLFADEAPVRAGWWESLVFWRGLTGLAAAAAVIAIGINLVQPRFNAQQMATELVAALQSQEGSGVSFVALYDTAGGSVRLIGLSGQEVADKDYELWYIRGDEPAVSMGVIPVDQRTEIALDAAARAKIAEGTVLAVTLEQKGGSPTGVAQGPIVAVGKAQPI